MEAASSRYLEGLFALPACGARAYIQPPGAGWARAQLPGLGTHPPLHLTLWPSPWDQPETPSSRGPLPCLSCIASQFLREVPLRKSLIQEPCSRLCSSPNRIPASASPQVPLEFRAAAQTDIFRPWNTRFPLPLPAICSRLPSARHTCLSASPDQSWASFRSQLSISASKKASLKPTVWLRALGTSPLPT